jgi:hypothetical protein
MLPSRDSREPQYLKLLKSCKCRILTSQQAPGCTTAASASMGVDAYVDRPDTLHSACIPFNAVARAKLASVGHLTYS